MRALSLKHEGWSQRTIAEALGVSRPAVSQWLAAAERGGPNALRSHSVSGRDCRLTAEQKRMIPEFLWHGPEAYGFRGQVWTCARIAQVIEEEFGVRYHKDHVGRLLKATAVDGSDADSPGHPARRTGYTNGGVPRSGPSCESGRGVSAGCWFSRTNRGFTSCRGWLGRTLPRGRRRSSTRNKLTTTCRSWAG